MIFIVPFIIGAIGAAVGAVAGISTAKAASEKYKQEAKHYRKIADELSDKYSKLQKQYYELGDKSKAENKGLIDKLAISEVEKDALHLVVELQNEIIQLIIAIDEYPSFFDIENLQKAISFTNLALAKFDKQLVVLPDNYISRNLNRALDSATSDQDISHYFYLYGQIFESEGKYQEAIQSYDKSIKIGYFNNFTYPQKASSLIELGKYQEAVFTLNSALSLDTNNAEIWSLRALAYSLLNKYDQEIKDYQHALVVNPNYYQVCYDKGFFFGEKGNKEKAIKYYDQAIKIKHDFAEAYYMRGILLLKLGDPLSNVDYEIYRQKGKNDLKIASKLFKEQNKLIPETSTDHIEYQIIFGNHCILYGNQVGIKACNKKYVMARLNDHGKLTARADHIKKWEEFEIVSAEESISGNKNRPVRYGEKIAFRSFANGRFVSSDLGNHGRLIAGALHLREWETFTLLPVKDDEKLGEIIEYDDDFVLQIHSKRIVYCRVKESGRICIDSNRTDGSEVFTFIKPSN